MDNILTLKTTPEGDPVRSTEIRSISIDLVNMAIAYNQQEIIVDLGGDEIRMTETQSPYSRNFSPESGNTPEKIAQAEALAQFIVDKVKEYHLANHQEEQNG